MKKSKDKKVQNFLEKLMKEDVDKFEILQELRKIVFAKYPKVNEKIIYGGIMFSVDDEDFGGVFSYKNHISFEFGEGYKFDDPDKLLEGDGKFRRHLKIKTLEDVNEKKVKFFVAQI